MKGVPQSTSAPVKKSGAINQTALALLVVALAICAACIQRVPKSEATAWRLRGRVVSITADTLNVRHKSGQVVSISIDEQTQFFVNRKPDDRQSVHLDTRVTIVLETTPAQGNHATRVDVFR